MQKFREIINAKSGALILADSEFFDSVQTEWKRLSNKNEKHPADLRRLHNKVSNWVKDFVGRDDWGAAKDIKAYDGALAWADMIDHELQNRAAVDHLLVSSTKEEGGFHNCAAHGLRKAIARRAANLGATQQQLKAVGGCAGDREVSQYTATANQKALAENGISLISD